MARLFILQKQSDNEEIMALIKLEDSIIACFKDRFIIRSYSPVHTIGGGFVVDINLHGKWKDSKTYASMLFENINDDSILVKLIVQNNKLKPYDLDSLAKKMGLSHNIINKYLIKENISFYGNIKNPWLLTDIQKNDIFEKILIFLDDFHSKNKYLRGVTKEQINAVFNFDINLLNELLLSLIKDEKINFEKEIYFLNSFEIKLDEKDQKIQQNIIEQLNKEKFNTSSIKELSELFNFDQRKLTKLIKIEPNNIIVINSTYIITKLNYNILVKIIENHFESNELLTVKDFKQLTDTSRKYAVPLLEYLDKEKITYRVGNERKKYK